MGPKMCINPSFVWVQRGPVSEKVPVACRKCWRCKKNRLSDYVARCMAEVATSETSCTVTLSYAPRDDLADKVIQIRHFQNFMKQLRNAGHKVRYFVAGEYGDLYGRTHFHAILFFKAIAPGNGVLPRYRDDYPEGTTPDKWGAFCREIPQKRMVHIREWPHGHIKTDWNADERAIRYVCKYLLREDKKNAWFSLSKKPPLGAEWFARKAALARDLGVLPSSFNYLPPGGKKGKSYLMTGATRRDYLRAVVEPMRGEARDLWGRDVRLRERMSEWVVKTFDKFERAEILAQIEAQPIEVKMAIDAEILARKQEQKAIMQAGDRARQREWVEALLDRASDGVLWLGRNYEGRDNVETW